MPAGPATHARHATGSIERANVPPRRISCRRAHSSEAKLSGLRYGERRAAGQPEGLLVLHHGRGTDERDLLALADELDPARRLRVLTPRAPLVLPGSPGYHWYVVPRVGYPDTETFQAAYRALAQLHDSLWAQTGISPQATVLGGFSMGTVMSYALGLGPERPTPAGILAFSGFLPTVSGWRPSFEDRTRLRAFIAHGRSDPVIDVAFARVARDTLQHAGLAVDYHESDAGHYIDPANIAAATTWLSRTIEARAG
jgi:phospholipase/carboxylesterase